MLTRCNHIICNYNIPPLLRSSVIVGLLGLSLLSTGCLYRIDIQQGNIVDSQILAKLKQGMTPDQVRYLIGTPLLIDVFHQQRWDYYYSLRVARSDIEQKKIQLYFKNDRLHHIEADQGLDIPALVPLAEDALPRSKPLL